MKAFYGEYNDRGVLYASFLLLKNVITGLLLSSDLCLEFPLLKVKAIALFYCTFLNLPGVPLQIEHMQVWTMVGVFVSDFLFHAFWSPNMDLFNGIK